MLPRATRLRGAAVLLLAAAAILGLAAAGAATEGLEALRQRSQEVRLQLAAEKARILREDPEAVALREQIEKLYRELDRLVSAKPAVARLQADLGRLEEALQAQTAPGAATRPAERTKP